MRGGKESGLKITDIEVITLCFRYPSGEGFQFAGGYCDARLSCLVRVCTDGGVTGIGSVYSHPELVRSIVEGQLRDLLVGEDPQNVETLWQRSYGITRWYGRKGAAVSALGGVDMALWDIRGKAAGKPVYELLGATRNQVPAYASALLWKDDIAELVREAKEHLRRGFRAMKTRLGRCYEYDVEAARSLRQAVGPGVRLMIEGNGRYNLPQAVGIAATYHDIGAFWFEEPFPPEDVAAYKALHPAVGIPLAAGENEFCLQGFRELVDGGYIDILQPDASRSGGITECHRVGMLAVERSMPIATHTWSDAVALVANMHLIAALPTGLTVEIDSTGNGLIDNLLAERLRVSDGQVMLPSGPGLGIQLSEDAVERYTLERSAPVPPGIYSDMVFGAGNYTPAPPYDQYDRCRMQSSVSVL
jgi:L-alanine-DL-glutamate epimerase-like enolase superfamily enzyme